MKPVRALVIDDSATMRKIISYALSSSPGIEVVGEAPDPTEAFRLVDTLDPDVITLDVEMPKMNGLDFLRRVMKHRPRPVIMVSTLTVSGAAVTVEALMNGAFDCVAKPSLQDDRTFADLADKVRAAGESRRARQERSQAAQQSHPAAAAPVAHGYRAPERIVAIGASTGGVEALITVLSGFPTDCPPTVITQHMPANFTRSFSERLDRQCKPTVTEARDRELLSPGHVYIAPGGQFHLEVTRRGDLFESRLREGDAVSGHRPSVDVLMSSVARAAGRSAVGAILTGMGRDGAQGLLQMRQAGARTIGQNEASSLIYGMPRVAHEIGAVEKQVHLTRISQEILDPTGAGNKGA
ncbi:protein-glutamate methylesterase/protein-glutamine glutaminase [Mesorhizobium sp. L-8-3]|uniref:protein-glutamate methylesterase/protein-glutamine glutaminase n=1 Tax=Mesorhizobium sp. L-8-3 TaxID=2744522 RepID=UPI0019257E94|nr:chemotaxis response regulator protein-glutamate methylesterase [Mesorhizobium sp. L-8-3]BCH23186.1 chemotaxis response regulator protein-glutamate methylesterase [Mesorhizobium sp. L-8-3]